MKATIEVESREEARQIRAALEDTTVRAFVRVMGVLQSLPTDRSRRRVMEYVADRFEEDREGQSMIPGAKLTVEEIE